MTPEELGRRWRQARCPAVSRSSFCAQDLAAIAAYLRKRGRTGTKGGKRSEPTAAASPATKRELDAPQPAIHTHDASRSMRSVVLDVKQRALAGSSGRLSLRTR